MGAPLHSPLVLADLLRVGQWVLHIGGFFQGSGQHRGLGNMTNTRSRSSSAIGH